ncbi:CIS tube protein [Haliangium sp.]|uniref:CIS tube protein n=1 Tax=Haliangium sp. TaxID=2663208 RepID=UPI003D0C06F4
MNIAAKAGASAVSGAHLVVLDPTLQRPDGTVAFTFNPTEFQVQKANSFAEIAIPGLEVPPIQFIRGGPEKLSFELLLDTSQELTDVRVVYVEPLRALMKIDDEMHAPRVLRFTWDTYSFTGVLDSLNITYLLFTSKGVPLRAKAQLSLKEYKPVSVQVREQAQSSPDVDKTYVVQMGDTLSSVAAAAYRDPARWRELARANGIRDPRRLAVGLRLRVPKLDGGGS